MPRRIDSSNDPSFQRLYPHYQTTEVLDTLRATDFCALDTSKEIYLDYTGGGLYGASQLSDHMRILQSAVLGNPHSDNPSSLRSTHYVEEARAAALAFFNASSDEYTAIFTPNATGALKLVGEAYPFTKEGRFLQLMDNHNSVNGIREFAKRRDTPIHLLKSRRSDLRVGKKELQSILADHVEAPHLFAYPAQSNFSGVQHPLDWIELAHVEGWDVLLDAAAFVPTNTLDLQKHKPDFVSLSFYKMFGWPTGVGCLLAKKTALARLKHPWFAGGTIWALSVQGDWHIPAPEHEAFEDGTVNYLHLPAVTIGLQYLRKIGIETIHTRLTCLTDWVLRQMQQLTHTNGQPLIEIYGPKDAKSRGGCIAFNVLTPDGRIIDERVISREAKKWKISLRTGCFCNPGSGEVAFNLSPDTLRAGYNDGTPQSFDEYIASLGLQNGGAIRVSFGMVSNTADTEVFMRFLTSFKDTFHVMSDLPARGHC